MNKQTARRRQALRAAAALSQPQRDDLGEPGALDQLDDAADPFADEDEAARQLAEKEQKQAKLDAFAAALAKKRQTAVEGRTQSGIEDNWREDEEHYEGIDDANRHEGVQTVKPRDLNGRGGASVVDKPATTGSTVFVNITRAYVDFSAGRAADMLLPTDDRNWDIRSTPMPDVIKAFNDERPLNLQGAAPGAPATIGEAARMMAKEAGDKVDKARKRIEDWHAESQYHAEQRKIIHGAAKVGVAILKGPIPMKSIARAVTKDDQGKLTMKVQNKLAPVSKAIDHWNFFPDPSCGEDIHNGNFVWERDRITARQLRDLIGTVDSDGNPMYLEDTIKLCLAEGAQRKFDSTQHHYQAPDAEQYEIWYYHGVASAEDLAAAGVTVEEGSVVPVVITMVNDRVIKAARSTLDSGDFPYDVFVWQPREGHWAGIGVARQVRTPQRILNAATRNMMDNAGLAAGPQIIIMDGMVKPLGKDDDYNLRPRKMWKLLAESKTDDVKKAIGSVVIPMLTAELMSIIQFALKTAEDVTGLPMLLQGQQGQASDTVGGMTLLTNNSNTPLRAIAKQYDDRITEPHLTRYYEWLLLYGEDDEKGEFIIDARGSSALFERDAQNQAILAMAPLVKDPDFKLSPAKWISEALKAQRLAPERFQYSDEEWAALQEQMKNAPPPVSERIEAARIAAASAEKRAAMQADVAQAKIAADVDRENIFQAGQREELALRERLAMLEYANREKISLDTLRTQLASDAMKIQAQKQLAGMDGKGPQVATPPTEPPGRAPTGEAYQR